MDSDFKSGWEWEEWPSGHIATTWHDGVVVDSPLEEWSVTVAQFMGCGFRVRVPATDGSDAMNHARGSAQRVAEAFSQSLDPAAWDAIATLPGPYVVEGGWSYVPGRPVEGGWTRVALGGRTHREARIARAARLPWAWSSGSPTASLPMMSTIEAGMAERHLRDAGQEVGLWFNTQDELCMSTVGPVLVQSGKRSWLFPDRNAGLISNWAFFEVATRLSARPAKITASEIDQALAICAISDLANVHLFESIDGEVVPLDPYQVGSLMQARLSLPLQF